MFGTLSFVSGISVLDKDFGNGVLRVGHHTHTHILRFLRNNWSIAQVVLRQMGYFGSPIDSDCGIFQGDILSPLFLNIIVDCILRQWHPQIDQVGTFYADDGRIAGFHQEALQQSLNQLLALFAQVGLFPNVRKTKAMVSYGRRHPDTLSHTAFKRRYDVNVPTYRARKLAKVQCPHCTRSMTDQYLPTHIRHVHHLLPDMSTDSPCTSLPPSPCKRQRLSDSAPLTSPNHYYISLSDTLVCPVPGCPTWTEDFCVFRRHLCIRHPTALFSFVGYPDIHQCPRCGMYITTPVTPRHLQSQFCIAQSARRERILSRSEAVLQTAQSTSFFIGDNPIEFVPFFRYLGRMLAQDDSDDMAAYARLEQTKKVWARFSHLLRANGASAKTMGRFYRTVLQQTLLFGSATWVLSPTALNRLERFHARCARGMTHRHIQRRPDGTWIYPPTAEVLEACGLQPLSVYIQRRRNTLLRRYATTESVLYNKCLSMPRPPRSGAWWQLPAL